jgi:hypothetical protein
MMTWMSDGVANPSKEIKRPGLRDGQTEGYLSNKQDEQNLAKSVSHLSWRILTYFEQSFNDPTRKVEPARPLFLLLAECIKQGACHCLTREPAVNYQKITESCEALRCAELLPNFRSPL